jgi:predicted negative regulator of RcsB-dependent stress response
MISSLERLERARAEYNKGEETLKGDALLEAQDRLRAAKARYREARHAFLPELARQCEQARVSLPREAAQALAALNDESNH